MTNYYCQSQDTNGDAIRGLLVLGYMGAVWAMASIHLIVPFIFVAGVLVGLAIRHNET
mgnify:CR=1